MNARNHAAVRRSDFPTPDGPPFLEYVRLAPPPHVRADRALRRLVSSLVDAGGETLAAILLFGSRLVGSDPDEYSAYDLVVVVDDYGAFFRGLASAGHIHRSPRLFTALGGVLPPTNISYRVTPDDPVLAKCMVLSERHLERALSPAAPDHFCLGRLVHRVALVHARGERERERVISLLAAGRRTSLTWVAPFIDAPFDVEDFARAMLRAAFGGEIRPEADDRPDRVLDSQLDFVRAVYGRLLEAACEEGILVGDARGYSYARPPSRWTRLRWRLYFRWSRWRSTVRWFKHMLTFEEWLDYIHRKVQRRMGLEFALTARERRFPLIFLWPRVFRVLRARGRRGSAASGKGRSREEDER